MQAEQLAHLVERPEIHRKILGDYSGAYSLGITKHPTKEGGAFLLRVEDVPSPELPRSVTINSEEIPVIVQGGFKAPKPL